MEKNIENAANGIFGRIEERKKMDVHWARQMD